MSGSLPGSRTSGWMRWAPQLTALTGVEAVSNGVQAFKAPNTQTARRTLTVIVILLALFLLGIAHLTRVYGIMATDPGKPGYQSLLSMLTAAVIGKGVIYYIVMGSILLMLSLSANTAFADFPRLCRAIAEDGFLPRFFAIRGRRLIYTEGVLVLARLIPLYAIGAFLAFTLSQAGMVAHWLKNDHKRRHLFMTINGVGAVATGCTVVVVLVAKFLEGAWITVLMVPLLIVLMRAVNRHYLNVVESTRVDRLTLDPVPAPVAVLPVSHWNQQTQAALRFATSLTRDVQVVHVQSEQNQDNDAADWQDRLNEASVRCGVPAPKVTLLPSPYRTVTTNLLNHVLSLEASTPDRQIAVVVPELVAARWWQYLLHNHRSTILKGLLLLQGNRRIVVVNVPWYLKDKPIKADDAK